MKLMFIIITFTCTFFEINAIWPPAYSINLTQSGTFVIAEEFGSDDISDIYDDDEMIKDQDIKNLNLDRDNKKYFQIHQMAMRRNKASNEDHIKKKVFITKPKESIFDTEDPTPWEAGYVNSEGELIQTGNQNVYYSNQMSAHIVAEKIEEKRQEEQVLAVKNITAPIKKIDYDYASFQADYINQVQTARKSNETLNYTDVKEEETVKEAVNKMMDFKETPRNCTKEETKGIGVAAIECFWLEAKKPKTSSENLQMLEKIGRIVLIWFCVYLAIAIPCWCQKGWCCCCCICKCCRPRERIDEAKFFLMNNPTGTLHIEDEEITYEPTVYEQYAQKRLEHALMKL